MTITILGLGSNLGERERYLAEAVREIAQHMDSLEYSPIYSSPALLPEGAPREWDMPFLNMAMRGDTSLAPHELLVVFKKVEERLGRSYCGNWGPRVIDIDILAYGDEVIHEADLQVPHAGLLKRHFALRPLADIAPGWRYPVPGPYQGKTALELIRVLNLEADGTLKREPLTLPMLR
jgi:2-amino-4-hydroxy-6-hydroxymethyldihydropteridine diphosphokinase/dihydropteroate synthase